MIQKKSLHRYVQQLQNVWMYCGLKYIKDAVNPVLETTAFFTDFFKRTWFRFCPLWLLNHHIVTFQFWDQPLNMVGGTVIMITYKKCNKWKKVSNNHKNNHTWLKKKHKNNGSILCKGCCIAGFSLKRFLQNNLEKFDNITLLSDCQNEVPSKVRFPKTFCVFLSIISWVRSTKLQINPFSFTSPGSSSTTDASSQAGHIWRVRGSSGGRRSSTDQEHSNARFWLAWTCVISSDCCLLTVPVVVYLSIQCFRGDDPRGRTPPFQWIRRLDTLFDFFCRSGFTHLWHGLIWKREKSYNSIQILKKSYNSEKQRECCNMSIGDTSQNIPPSWSNTKYYFSRLKVVLSLSHTLQITDCSSLNNFLAVHISTEVQQTVNNRASCLTSSCLASAPGSCYLAHICLHASHYRCCQLRQNVSFHVHM